MRKTRTLESVPPAARPMSEAGRLRDRKRLPLADRPPEGDVRGRRSRSIRRCPSWALRESNPRPSPCRGETKALVRALSTGNGAPERPLVPPATSGLRCPRMRFCVLGPVEVFGEGGDPLPITGSKERTISPISSLTRVASVSADDLIDELWGERPPRTAEKTLGSHVSKLRGALERGHATGWLGDVIATRSGGYLLESAKCEIDALDFERLAKEGPRDPGRGPPRCCLDDPQRGTRSRRGAAYQEPRTRASALPKERGWRSCGDPRSKIASTRSSASGLMERSSPNWRAWSVRNRCGSDAGGS